MGVEDCCHQWALANTVKSTGPFITATWLCPLCSGFMVVQHAYDVNEVNQPLSVQLAQGRGKRQRNPEAEAEDAEALRD